MTLIQASLLSTIVTAARIGSGLVLNKLFAVVLGPTGFALVGQFTTFASMAYGLSTAGLGNGVVRYVAGSPPNLAAILGTALVVCIGVTSTITVTLLVVPGQVAQWVLGSAEHVSAIVVVALANLVIAPSTLLLAILNGRKELRSVTIFGLVGVALALSVTVLMTLTLDLFGALVAQAIAQALLAIAVLGYFWWSKRLSQVDLSRPDSLALRGLLQYSVMAIVAAVALPLALIVIRNHIADNLSWVDAGYWQGVWRISEMYMLAITGVLNLYLLPRFSEVSAPRELRRELISSFKVLVPAVAGMGFAIYLSRFAIIHTLFDERFLAMADLFAFQLIGDVAKIAAWILAYLLIAKAMTATYIILEVSFVSLFVLLNFSLIDRFGLVGATYAYAITYFLNLLVLGIIVARYLAKLERHFPRTHAAA
jgi:polysaccharide transporter, PST family